MNRSTLLVLGVFVALMVAAVALVTRSPERGITRISFADLDTKKVDRLEIGGKNAVNLVKKDDGWYIEGGRRADGDAVQRLLDALGKVKSSDLVTRDSSRFADFEVDDEKGTAVTAFAGKAKLAHLVVGKSASGGAHVRVDEGVFRVGGIYPAVFSRAPGAWVDKKLFTEKNEAATRLDVRLAGTAPYALVKKDGSWAFENPDVVPKGFRFDANAAKGLVDAVAGVRVKEYEKSDPGAEKTGLNDAADVWVLTFSGEGNSSVSYTLRVGNKKEGGSDLWAKVDSRDDVFTLPEFTVKSLKRSATDLRDLKMMSFDVSKAERLSVSDGAVGLTFEKKDGSWSLVKSSEPKPNGFELDPSAVERRLSAVADARGLSLATPGNDGLARPSAKVSVTLTGGKVVTLSFGKETKSGGRDVIYARGNADDATYFLAKWSRQSLTGGIKSFEKHAGPPGLGNIDPQALSSLPPDVRESLMKQLQQKQREQQLLKQIQAKAGSEGAH